MNPALEALQAINKENEMHNRMTVFGLAAGVGLLLTATLAAALTPAQEGRRVYLRENCYGCHGGRAGGGMGPNLRSEADDVSEAVRQGEEGGMPAYPNISSLDIQNLQAYFRSIRTASEPTFTHWWEPVPSR
jgi:mono/diheme cytochrome c family protein